MRRLKFSLVVLLFSMLAGWSGCGGETVTSIELAVSYDDAWQLERFDIDVEGVETSVAASHTVELWVPDSLAGQALSIEVSGMRKNQDGKLERYAFGRTTATPALAEAVTAQVALTRLPCGAWCNEGESSCQGDSVVTCTNRDDDSCLEWADPVPCTGGDSCSLGACRSECIDECASGELRCAGPAGVQQCGNFDSDSCLEWSDVALCSDGESCSGGSCVQGCRDECTDGDTACSGGGIITCSDRNFDGCTEWGPVESCSEGQSCSNGGCVDGCEDECAANTCEGATLRECGQFDADECLDKSPGTSCHPVDLCMEGMCDPVAGCSTTDKVCEEPPSSECIEGTTLRRYDKVGLCGDGVCEYSHHDTPCEGGCAAGACLDACADVKCESPPSPTCINSSTLRKFASPGTCSGRDCSYSSVDLPCSGRCESGACLSCANAPSYTCPNSWTYREANGFRICESPVFTPPANVKPYCLFAALGEIGFYWSLADDPSYSCPASAEQTNNDAGSEFCRWDVDYPPGSESSCEVAAGRISYKWPC